MKLAESSSLKHVQYFRAPDDRRPVAIFISGQFDEFEKFPPFMKTEEEIQHVREAYKITDPLLERTTKAHITDNSRPLQIILLERDPRGDDAAALSCTHRGAPRASKNAPPNSRMPKRQSAGRHFYSARAGTRRSRYASE